jgi:hypothetical protein
LRARLLALLLGTLASLLCAELGLRWLVLSQSGLARKLGAGVRQQSRFAGPNDDDYWKLQFLFTQSPAAMVARPDRMCGWLTGKIASDSHEHMDEPKLGERTPVLLYGDSFAEGVIPGPGTFEELLEASPSARTHAMLNYGVGGFGTDQALLLLRDTLPRWKARDPVAILEILVEDDLDRCILGFRTSAKPRFRVQDGQLVDPEPVEPDLQRYFEQHPLEITSYLVRLIARHDGLLPVGLRRWLLGDDGRWQEKQELAEAIVRSACRALRAGSPRCALLLARGCDSTRDPNSAVWQERLIRRVAAEEGVRVLDTREPLIQAVHGKPELLENLYVRSGPAIGHWNERGNRVVLQVMRAFIDGGPPEQVAQYVAQLLESGQLPEPSSRIVKGEALGGELLVKFSDEAAGLCFMQSKDAPGHAAPFYLGLRAGMDGPSTLRWTPPAGSRRLSLELRAVQQGAGPDGAELVVHVQQRERGETRNQETLRLVPGQPARDWQVELLGTLELRIDPPAPGQRSAWLMLEKARFQ